MRRNIPMSMALERAALALAVLLAGSLASAEPYRLTAGDRVQLALSPSDAPVVMQVGADGSRHGFFDQENLPRAGVLGRFLNGPALDRGRARRHADNDLRRGEGAVIVNLPDEVLDHLLGNFEVGDHTVSHGSDRLDRAGRTAQHALGLVAHGEHPPLTARLSQRHH